MAIERIIWKPPDADFSPCRDCNWATFEKTDPPCNQCDKPLAWDLSNFDIYMQQSNDFSEFIKPIDGYDIRSVKSRIYQHMKYREALPFSEQSIMVSPRSVSCKRKNRA